MSEIPVPPSIRPDPSAPSTVNRSSSDMIDRFLDDRQPGGVIGSKVDNMIRKGVDKEGVIGIDHGALRIQPLVAPEWGRSGIAYGPYKRANGLAFGVFLINGHNTSQAEPLLESLRMRWKRWLLGSETEKPITRLKRWMRSRQRKYIWRRFLQWTRSAPRLFHPDRFLDENLAVGWFPSEAPRNPLQQGNSFIMHALGPECGDLWVRTGVGSLRTVRGLQNVQTYYIVILREEGAAYYAASISGVPGLDAYPRMRLLGIDAFAREETVYAGVHQSVLGQIGFRVDTRVYRTQVATLPSFEHWYGSAHGADLLAGDGSLHMSTAEKGRSWTVCEGKLNRAEMGATAADERNLAILMLPSPSGLIHLLVHTGNQPSSAAGIVWRARDAENYWKFDVDSQRCQLSLKENGIITHFPVSREFRLAPNGWNSLQVVDDGENFRLYVNGDLVFGTSFSDRRLEDACGAGVFVAGGAVQGVIRSFEAHPREISIPDAFDLGEPWLEQGQRVVTADDFSGGGADLAGRICPSGQQEWRKEMGQGAIRLTGASAARVVGTVQEPCPGRTAYTVAWSNPAFADVSVKITPPGTRRGMKERGRGGLIFWQDANTYITLSIFMDDWYGTSIAAFFYVDGYEELYDAVWTNVGKRIHWGVPYDFRVVFDGRRFLAFVNDEPVLYRALSDIYPDWEKLDVQRIGIVANWEWGNDTGTTFEHFVAKDRV
jgi:hypothetical protein